ncbi:hypothetical protein [Microbacterium oxydans]|uniref:hypothetical protein n=2 Tax=Microbacteriaceae TaxID=85023 RepID=UPI00332B37AC
MQMNEPQVWTLIGVFAAFMLGALTVLIRQNDKMTSSLRRELGYRFETMETKLQAMETKFEAMDARVHTRFDALEATFDARLGSVDRRLEELDKEVAHLATRFWGSR